MANIVYTVPQTKFRRELITAQKVVQQKGIQVTWTKISLDPASDFAQWPDSLTPISFDGVWAVFYPQTRQNLESMIADAINNSTKDNLFCIIAGGLPFTINRGDRVVLPDTTVRSVTDINITQPDYVPLVYEVTLE